MKQKVKTKKELRNFGFVMAVPLTLIGAYLWWKGKGGYPFLWGAAGFFLFSGILVPQLLRPIEKVWVKVAEIMGAVMSRVILTLAFYLMITPLGILLRIMGKDLLDLKKSDQRQSYWVPVERDGPSSRPTKPY